jgi:hypothetical protein
MLAKSLEILSKLILQVLGGIIFTLERGFMKSCEVPFKKVGFESVSCWEVSFMVSINEGTSIE